MNRRMRRGGHGLRDRARACGAGCGEGEKGVCAKGDPGAWLMLICCLYVSPSDDHFGCQDELALEVRH
eukprot:10066277-Prorocentrum_lima.AAC.1